MRGLGILWRVAALEFAPAALLGFAVAFAVATLFRNDGSVAIAAGASIASGIAAWALAWWGVRRLADGDSRYALPGFEDFPLEFSEMPHEEIEELLLTDEAVLPAVECSGDQDELLLTEVVTLFPERAARQDELLLSDMLVSLRPDSRVVRLFDSNPVPTAGELQQRIERHLACDPQRFTPPDASAELRDAIAALRQSLR